MFVNIMQLPPVKEGRDDEFRQWFTWSNQQYRHHDGFISRRLLKPHKGNNYAIIVEHESQKSFIKMHSSPTQATVHERLKPLLEGGPTAQFYDLVAG